MRILAVLFAFLSMALVSGCPSEGPAATRDGSVPEVTLTDEDGDTISDDEEGRPTEVDTDGDGAPDYLDLDSDGDGYPDSEEAGDADLSTPAADGDGDGIPDFRDLDSDGNGIPDAEEGDDDTDGDGIPNYRDTDDDNDFVPDERELMGAPPADSDGDGVPNHLDPDSDGDFILDGDEFGPDTDGDGVLDWLDADSDNDGIPDSEEAGDEDLRTRPVDSDDDGTPDFRDVDSDNDGLSDTLEREGGTSPTEGDSDGDGVSDLIEVAAGTDPLDGESSPRTRGDFVFVVPYMEDPSPPRDTLEFRTNIQFADIYFLFDISGSMDSEIGALRTAVGDLVRGLTCEDTGTACTRDSECGTDRICSNFTSTCIDDPAVSSCLLSPWTGGGYYEDEYRNLLSLQPNPADTASALMVDTFGGTEKLYRAAWGVADPAAAPGAEVNCAAPMAGLIGCPAFREEAVRILVAFTDEDSDGEESVEDAGAALQAAGISMIGVWSGTASHANRTDLVDLAVESGSLDGSGSPLVFDGADASVVPAVSAAINEIVQGVPLRITIAAADETGDAGDALQFIDYLEVNTSGGACTAIASTEDTDGDGHDDAFPAVLPGTPVCWDVVPARNDTVEPDTTPLVFRARLTVSGDGSPLDARTVYFLVPPYIPPPMGPE